MVKTHAPNADDTDSGGGGCECSGSAATSGDRFDRFLSTAERLSTALAPFTEILNAAVNILTVAILWRKL